MSDIGDGSPEAQIPQTKQASPPDRARSRFTTWLRKVWHGGWREGRPTLRGVLGGTVSLVVAAVLAWWGVATSQQIAHDDDISQAAAQAEQHDQGETLERIEKNLQGLSGTNPASTQPSSEGKSVPCRDDGERFRGGWGPERPLYKDAVTPSYTLFNSVLDNPNTGDERGFYAIKDAANTSDGGWQNSITVEREHTYILRIYMRNDSAYPLAESTNSRIMVNLPVCEGTSIQSTAFITSNNAFPVQVYSSIAMQSDEVFNLAYVQDSLTLYNNSTLSPFRIPSTDFLTATGQLIGFDAMDGTVRPGYSNATYAFFRIKPQFAPR